MGSTPPCFNLIKHLIGSKWPPLTLTRYIIDWYIAFLFSCKRPFIPDLCSLMWSSSWFILSNVFLKSINAVKTLLIFYNLVYNWIQHKNVIACSMPFFKSYLVRAYGIRSTNSWLYSFQDIRVEDFCKHKSYRYSPNCQGWKGLPFSKLPSYSLMRICWKVRYLVIGKF